MIDKRQLSVLAMVVGLLAMGAGGAMAAAPTVDTETTDTSSQSEVTDGMTIVDFEANSNNTSVLQASYDSDNPKVEVLGPDNETIKTYTAADMNETNASANYYNASIKHSVWNNVEISPGENVTTTIRLTNNTQAESPDTTNVTVHLDGADGRTVRVVGSSLSDDVFSTAATGTFPVVGTLSVDILGWGQDTSTYSADSGVPINGTNSTVELHYANDSAVSSLSTVADELDANAWAKSIIVQSDSGPIKTYVDEAPDDVDSSTTYAVYETSANDLVIHTGDDYEGETSISGLSVNGNAGIVERIQVYGLGSAVPDIPMIGMLGLGGGSGLSLAGAFLFFRVEDQEAA